MKGACVMEDIKEIQSEIVKNIEKYNTIILQRHQSPDPDAYGSQIGLAEIIRHSFPSKHVYQVGSDDKGLDWIGNPQQISDDTYKNALVIVTDCANGSRISDNRYKIASKVIKIDHHPVAKREAKDDAYADINWINPEASSASEMVYDLCASSDKLHMTDNSARCIYAGMVGDTGRFMFPSTTTHTFYVAMQLSKYNFSMSEVNQDETRINLNVALLYGYLEQHLHVLKNGTAYYVLTQKLINKYHITSNDFISKNIPSSINGIVAWAMITEKTPDEAKQSGFQYKVSLRSHKPVISGLAENHNGGGHALASGAKAKNKGEVKQIIKGLSNIVDDYKTNK